MKTNIKTALGTALFGFTTLSASAQGFLQPGDNPGAVAQATGGESSARSLFLTMLNYFLGFLGLVAVVMIIYGGFLVLTAAGDAEKAGKGKKILLYAGIGLLIILLSFAIVFTVLQAGTGQQL